MFSATILQTGARPVWMAGCALAVKNYNDNYNCGLHKQNSSSDQLKDMVVERTFSHNALKVVATGVQYILVIDGDYYV